PQRFSQPAYRLKCFYFPLSPSFGYNRKKYGMGYVPMLKCVRLSHQSLPTNWYITLQIWRAVQKIYLLLYSNGSHGRSDKTPGNWPAVRLGFQLASGYR